MPNAMPERGDGKDRTRDSYINKRRVASRAAYTRRTRLDIIPKAKTDASNKSGYPPAPPAARQNTEHLHLLYTTLTRVSTEESLLVQTTTLASATTSASLGTEREFFGCWEMAHMCAETTLARAQNDQQPDERHAALAARAAGHCLGIR